MQFQPPPAAAIGGAGRLKTDSALSGSCQMTKSVGISRMMPARARGERCLEAGTQKLTIRNSSGEADSIAVRRHLHRLPNEAGHVFPGSLSPATPVPQVKFLGGYQIVMKVPL